MKDFTSLGLGAPILKALDDAGYVTPTPIQSEAIPVVLKGRDLMGIAQTGTGKTAAFALPILSRLAADRRPPPHKGCRCLVLSPTRELATQIAESFRTYGRHLRPTVAVVFGGIAHAPQVRALAKGVDILVATPGRLLDHMAERSIVLRDTEVFVLDEADQMLDLGFFKPIRTVVATLPASRQSLFFSATMPPEIAKLAGELLRDPIRVAVTPVASTVDRITQRVIRVESSKKRALLAELLADTSFKRTLVFTRTKRGADRVAKGLDEGGIHAAAIHGNKSQRQREEALAAFRAGRVRVLVATDIAARGIDIDSVTHVINYEMPEVPEAYVHRIGRTARAGADGAAVSLCDAAEIGLLRAIERLTRQTIPTEDRRNDTGLAPQARSGYAPERSMLPPGERERDRDGEDRGGERRRGPRKPHGARDTARVQSAGPAAKSETRFGANATGKAKPVNGGRPLAANPRATDARPQGDEAKPGRRGRGRFRGQNRGGQRTSA